MKQHEALRLAKELVMIHQGHADEGPSTFSEAAAELRRLHHNNGVLLNALWKACGDNKTVVNNTIKSQGELK
jgi:hypothetical protein